MYIIEKASDRVRAAQIYSAERHARVIIGQTEAERDGTVRLVKGGIDVETLRKDLGVALCGSSAGYKPYFWLINAEKLPAKKQKALKAIMAGAPFDWRFGSEGAITNAAA